MTPSSTTIRRRFQLAVAAFVLALLIPAASGWWSVHRLAAQADSAVHEAMSAQQLSAHFVAAAMQAVDAGQTYVLVPSNAVRERFRERGQAAHDIAQSLSQDATASADVAGAVVRLNHQLSLLENHLVRAHLYVDLGEPAAARRELDLSVPYQTEMLRAVGDLGEAQSAHLGAATDAMRRATKYQGLVFLLVFAVALLAGTLAARWLARTVAGPLARLVAHAGSLAARRSDAHTPVESVPGEFGALALAMNEAGASLVRLADAEAAANRNQRLALVGRLASGVAHELNNPLHTILLTVELLQEEVTDPVQRRELDVVRAQADRARDIVRDLMSSARDEARPREFVPADSIVRRAEDELARLARRSDARLVLDLPARSLPVIEVDRSDLTRLLGILVSNAAHAVGAQGTITIRADDRDGACRFIVEDDGPGLTDEVTARLFEPFFTTKPVGQGTGLGLPVALGIAESHGGSITPENRTDRTGARFIVRIPHARKETGGTEQVFTAEQPIVRVSATPASTRPRALVVDDEPTVRAVLGKILSRDEWRVDEAADGKAALTLIAEAEAAGDRYTFILCDLRMPSMCGIALHDVLMLQYPATLRQMTIASGDLASPDVVALIERTECAVMEKPLDMKAVLRVAAAARRTPPGGSSHVAA